MLKSVLVGRRTRAILRAHRRPPAAEIAIGHPRRGSGMRSTRAWVGKLCASPSAIPTYARTGTAAARPPAPAWAPTPPSGRRDPTSRGPSRRPLAHVSPRSTAARRCRCDLANRGHAVREPRASEAHSPTSAVACA